MMSEIADLTYHVVAFSEIMQMLWKRLNDSGKNWRHVYKVSTVLNASRTVVNKPALIKVRRDVDIPLKRPKRLRPY